MKVKEVKYKVGQIVLLENVNIKGQGRKLQPLFLGPYDVTNIPSGVYIEIKVGKEKNLSWQSIETV